MKPKKLSDPNALYGYLHINKDLVTGFFIMFSRFEYALKRAKYCQNCTEAKPDWITFAKEYNASFIADKNHELKTAVQYLLENPPKRQVVNNGKLGWETVGNTGTQLERILRSVRTVRNNLFHGGKFESGSVDEPARNAVLLESCITILRTCLALNKDIESFFWNIYQQ